MLERTELTLKELHASIIESSGVETNTFSRPTASIQMFATRITMGTPPISRSGLFGSLVDPILAGIITAKLWPNCIDRD